MYSIFESAAHHIFNSVRHSRFDVPRELKIVCVERERELDVPRALKIVCVEREWELDVPRELKQFVNWTLNT